MRFALIAVVAAIAAATIASATPTTPLIVNTTAIPVVSLVRNGDGNFVVIDGDNVGALAGAQYNASGYDHGWDFLRVWPHRTVDGRSTYYMGVLEGILTAKRIAAFAVPTASPRAQQWIAEHLAFMQRNVAKATFVDRQWTVIGALLDQLQGLADGFNAANIGTNRTFLDMFMINFVDEVGDVEIAVKVQNGEAPPVKSVPFDSHCSALVKVTANDLFVAHDTWDSFSGMELRIYKVYNYRLDAVQTDELITFSAHPAFIASGDDWYQTRTSQLAVFETTNDIANNTLYEYVVPATISEFLRTMSATILAKDGEEWTTYFSRYNSGTYNNQYVVVDFKKFSPGADIAPGTLWIAEQIPGYIARFDASEHLQRESYWAAYNIAFDKYIYNVSGYQALYEQQGDFWSYSKYSRAELFARNQSLVTDLESMQRIMRLNNWQVDPLSAIQNCTAATNGVCSPKNSAMNAIASRGDLMTVYNTTAEMIAHYGVVYAIMAQGCFGAIDTKIASWSNRHSMTARVISGPTNDQVPTFSWGTTVCPHVPATLPRVIDFPWIDYVLEPYYRS